MRRRDIRRIPQRKQFATVAQLYKLEILELCHLCGHAVVDAATAAARMVYDLAYYHKHRPVR